MKVVSINKNIFCFGKVKSLELSISGWLGFQSGKLSESEDTPDNQSNETSIC